MSKRYEFKTIIHKNLAMDAAYVEVPFHTRKEFGKGRVEIRATFDGYPYQGQLVPLGTLCHILGISKDICQAIGKGPGDEIYVTLKEG